MTPADLQIPERESAPVEDPAVVTGKEAKEAAAAFSAIAKTCRTSDDENTPEFVAADKRTTEADAAFADAPVTSVAGALAKMREIVDLGSDDNGTSLDTRHIKTVIAFLEGGVGEAQAEPLVELWTEQNRLVALGNAAETDPELDALGDELSAVEHRIANTEARTLAGVLVQIKLRESVLGHAAWVLSADLTRNVITALERMGGAQHVPVADDPAVAALAEYRVANAALEAFPDDEAEADTPEYEAAGARRYAARGAVYDVVPTSMAGMAAKVRFIVDHEERGNDLWVPFDAMAKSMLPFLEGGAAVAPPTVTEPDPVVTLFAEWGTLQDEAMALHKTDPEAVDPHVQKQHDELYDRQSEIERQIIDTAATSVGGIAVKLRLLAYIEFPMKGLPDLHRTPAKDTDFKGIIEAWRADIGLDGLDWQDDLLIGALRDAERLAGAS